MECHFLMLQKIPWQYLPKCESCYDFHTSIFATSVATDPLTHLPRDNLVGKFADIFRCIFCEENVWISIEISLRFVPKALTDCFPYILYYPSISPYLLVRLLFPYPMKKNNGCPYTLLCPFFTPQPSGLEGYCRHGPGGRAGGRLPNLRNPYLCNRLMDFLHSKFCGIV